jgi:peptidoglycan/xylan/chitin deacetylase (PgdA/CDA1 family)
MLLALKVDVSTLRGAREGVPRLIELLQKLEARATFLFSLGPDRSGRAKAKRGEVDALSPARGLRGFLYRTLLPAPNIARRGAEALRRVRDAGFEAGILSYDSFQWRARVVRESAQWTEQQIALARYRFESILGESPKIHAAAGWRTNRHALRFAQKLDFDLCSDCRGDYPFIPVLNAELFSCPQFPTTLPTLSEALAFDPTNPDAAIEQLLKASRYPPATGHVYTARAEHEGGRYAPALEKLLAGWRDLGFRFLSLGELFQRVDLKQLPKHELVLSVAGEARQGKEFLAD